MKSSQASLPAIVLVLVLIICCNFIVGCKEDKTQGKKQEEIIETIVLDTTLTTVKTYCAPRTSSPITIDGKDTDDEWKSAKWSDLFVDIEGQKRKNPNLKTKVKMMWDETNLYVFAELEEPHIWATLKERDAVVYHDDDFEVFIDPDGDSHYYYEIEVNAYNTLWDLMLTEPYRNGRNDKVLWRWDIPKLQSAVHISGTINDPSDTDERWNVEMAIPMETLTEFSSGLKPAPGVQWRINFSRVDWQMDIIDGEYQKTKNDDGKSLAESNWVWSPQGKIAMHMPEMWGILQFVDNSDDPFIPDPDRTLKIELRNIYKLLLNEHKNNGSFPSDLEKIPLPTIDSCTYTFSLESTSQTFWLSKKSCDTELTWAIDERGRLFQPSQVHLY